MDAQGVIEVLRTMSRRMESERDFLTELDNRIADGDHGINMARGFVAVEKLLSGLADKDIGTILKTVGMTLVSVVGGTAGLLYGTAFLKAGMTVGDKTEMDINDLLACLKTAVDGVMMRGHAARGEKTMLDAMIPALEAMEQSNAEGAPPKEVLASGLAAAEDGVEFTKTIAATKGRASYIGERSIGHQDPGATSFTILLGVIANAL